MRTSSFGQKACWLQEDLHMLRSRLYYRTFNFDSLLPVASPAPNLHYCRIQRSIFIPSSVHCKWIRHTNYFPYWRSHSRRNPALLMQISWCDLRVFLQLYLRRSVSDKHNHIIANYGCSCLSWRGDRCSIF